MLERSLCVIHTGGTISMVPSDRGLLPKEGVVESFIAQQAAHDPLFPQTSLVVLDPLIDSSGMGTAEWNSLLAVLRERWDAFDRFVVIHGTDTMAYTASLLAYLAVGSNKRILFTGSQAPLLQDPSDAVANLSGAIKQAADCKLLPGVYVYFNNKCLPAVRSHKVDSRNWDAFITPYRRGEEAPPPQPQQRLVSPWEAEGLPLIQRDFLLEAIKLSIVTFFPGLSGEALYQAGKGCDALVMALFGAGNLPHQDPLILEALQKLEAEGCFLVGASQCLHRDVSFGDYESSAFLKESSFVAGGDMTLEAIVAKLYILWSLPLSAQQRRRLFLAPLAGDRTLK